MTLIASIQFDSHYFWQHLLHPQGFFLKSVETTVYLAIAGQALGTIMGLPLAIARRSTNRLLVALAWLYSWFWRGTPLLVQLYDDRRRPRGAGIYRWQNLNLGLFTLPGEQQAAIVTLALAEAAYMSEIFRAAIGAIDRGQWEAAKTVGMAPWPTMRLVILPQAARVVVPPARQRVHHDAQADLAAERDRRNRALQDDVGHQLHGLQAFEIFFVAAIWYLLLTSVWSLIQNRIEARLARSDRAVVAAPDKTSIGRMTGFR